MPTFGATVTQHNAYPPTHGGWLLWVFLAGALFGFCVWLSTYIRRPKYVANHAKSGSPPVDASPPHPERDIAVTSGTWTKPAGLSHFQVYGGGAGGAGVTCVIPAAGGGGGGGGSVHTTVWVVTASTSGGEHYSVQGVFTSRRAALASIGGVIHEGAGKLPESGGVGWRLPDGTKAWREEDDGELHTEGAVIQPFEMRW